MPSNEAATETSRGPLLQHHPEPFGVSNVPIKRAMV